MKPTERLEMVDLLRGVTALGVAAGHFSATLPEASRGFVMFYGTLGVRIFFVISGFIVPYGLARAGYTLRSAHTFLLKRGVRLYPPYLVAVALTLAITYAGLRANGLPWPETPGSLFQIAAYLRTPPENPVFWTLTLEIQFYVFIALAYPLFIARGPRWNALLFVGLIAAGFLGRDWRFLNYIEYFRMGIATFLARDARMTAREYFLWLAILVASATYHQALVAAIICLVAALAIRYANFRIAPALLFPGKISYTLYLVHFPVGVSLLNHFLQPSFSTADSLLLFAGLMAVTMLVAWILFLLVERPALRLSHRIRYAISAPKDS